MARYVNPRRRREDPVRWMVTRERFQLPDMEPPVGEPDVAVREIVNDIFKSIDVRRQPALLDQIREAWRELVGPGAATHARPGYLDRQTLVIFVDSAVWLNELVRYENVRLLGALQGRFGADHIRNLRFLNDPDGGRRTEIEEDDRRRTTDDRRRTEKD
ncbi:MAG: DUF721 domain-containing protein [Kiritimatiellaeota bacterium]|nr:DUF721 domain-containing protein [Kiritimatiellota bacterium]